MNEITIGAYSLPVILTVVLGMIYKAVPQIPDRFKPFIAAAFGIGLGVAAMYYNLKAPFTVSNWIDYILYGFMMGASAVGLWEMQKKVTDTKYTVVDEFGNPIKGAKLTKRKILK